MSMLNLLLDVHSFYVNWQGYIYIYTYFQHIGPDGLQVIFFRFSEVHFWVVTYVVFETEVALRHVLTKIALPFSPHKNSCLDSIGKEFLGEFLMGRGAGFRRFWWVPTMLMPCRDVYIVISISDIIQLSMIPYDTCTLPQSSVHRHMAYTNKIMTPAGGFPRLHPWRGDQGNFAAMRDVTRLLRSKGSKDELQVIDWIQEDKIS